VESEWLAVGYYELGRLELARGAAAAAVTHFKAAVRADRDFLRPRSRSAMPTRRPAITARRCACGSARRKTRPALPLLARLERAYRHDARPSR
jgi:hypothetical protein